MREALIVAPESNQATQNPGERSYDDWLRLGNAVRRRRNHLRISQGAGDVSPATWRKIEKAVDPPYRDSTLIAICRTLQWTPDSFERILAGEEPIDASAEPEPSRRERNLEQRIADLEAEVGWIKVELAGLGSPSARARHAAEGGYTQPDDPVPPA